ncbi:unnamed protein product, partial [Nesidiocoris tenuis]
MARLTKEPDLKSQGAHPDPSADLANVRLELGEQQEAAPVSLVETEDGAPELEHARRPQGTPEIESWRHMGSSCRNLAWSNGAVILRRLRYPKGSRRPRGDCLYRFHQGASQLVYIDGEVVSSPRKRRSPSALVGRNMSATALILAGDFRIGLNSI